MYTRLSADFNIYSEAPVASVPITNATREGRVYLEQIQAAAEAAESGGIPENTPVIVKAEGVILPEKVKLGEP